MWCSAHRAEIESQEERAATTERESDDRVPKRRRTPSRSAAVQKEEGSSSSCPAMASATEYVMAKVDTDILDCGVCFLPLKPPLFQCEVGHVVCEPCRERLAATGKCHVCGVSTAGGYHRCHDMERMVESFRVACPNAARGCTVTPAYYDQHGHRQTCAHAPCHCPGDACGFVGLTTELWEHFSGVHRWPCTTKALLPPQNNSFASLAAMRRDNFSVRLYDGFNFLLVDRPAGDQGAATSTQYLFLLNVARQALGRAISVLWIHPHGHGQGPSSKEIKFRLEYSRNVNIRPDDGDLLVDHFQNSVFRVECTNLSYGLPSPEDGFQFVVPDSVVADSDWAAIKVTARIIIV